MSRRPRIALTIGDPLGIGPEIVLRLLAQGPPPEADLVVVGDAHVLERAVPLCPGAAVPPVIASPEAVEDLPGRVGLLEAFPESLDELPPPGRVDALAGRASHAWVLAAAGLAGAGRVDAVVTGPIHKEAWERAGVRHPGHTEVLAEAAGVPRVLMLLTGGGLRVALATIHVALARVPGLLETQRLTDDLRLLSTAFGRDFGPERPRIAVAGLNPHAGEGGLFGGEDDAVIRPAVQAARAEGIDAVGPLPADACIPAAAQGTYDVALAMYHDQGLVAVKTLAPRRAVNVTLGLPFVRTSVDHGTAFDKAGRGVATCTSLDAALRTALDVVCRRQGLNARPAASDLEE